MMGLDGLDSNSLAISAGVLTALILGNIGAILGGWLSLRERITKLEVKADTQSRDLNNLGKIFRRLMDQNQRGKK